MRNLKIGAKIFVAFGVVIALMLLSAAVVFISNTGIIGNVDKIDKDSALQTAGNTLKDNFLSTRVAAVRVLSTTDPAVYDSFVEQADIATQNYAEVYKQINENSFLEKFRPAFEQAENDYNIYLAKAAELGQANVDEETQIERMNAAGAHLAQYSDVILHDQEQMLRDEMNAGGVPLASQLRRVDRLEAGADISLNIVTFRMYAREMMANFDTANMPKTLEVVDATYAMLDSYYKASTLVKQQENSQLLMESITQYRAALVDFGAACDHSAKASAELTALGTTALESLSAAVDSLDTAMSNQVQNTTSSATSSLIVVMSISLLSIIVSVVLALVIMKGITTPVKKMVRAADSIALGDVGVDVHYESKDEIGSLSASFEKMLTGIKTQVDVIECLADGDLTVDISPRSDKDTMGHGLNKMVDNLNEMFADINRASDQVSTGAKQLSDGAQSLAQGSTEQASAVEQLSASISQIAIKTKDNANMASKAAELAGSIKQNAAKGSTQMTNMMQAVKEINDSSQDISKVIKVIDDIAFQTNILALNAAVEAARAGQHGKGFAVVAEEVRNLAAKSLEAAKDTGELIANSMDKAAYGSSIAQETAASLAEIVSGINESTRIVTDIARVSEEQSASVSQINIGIDQVAQVVQQNSATAQESAAASEEMSAQSDMLRQRVAQFKLKSSSLGAARSNGRTLTPGSSKEFALDGSDDYSDRGSYGKY